MLCLVSDIELEIQTHLLVSTLFYLVTYLLLWTSFFFIIYIQNSFLGNAFINWFSVQRQNYKYAKQSAPASCLWSKLQVQGHYLFFQCFTSVQCFCVAAAKVPEKGLQPVVWFLAFLRLQVCFWLLLPHLVVNLATWWLPAARLLSNAQNNCKKKKKKLFKWQPLFVSK